MPFLNRNNRFVFVTPFLPKHFVHDLHSSLNNLLSKLDHKVRKVNSFRQQFITAYISIFY